MTRILAVDDSRAIRSIVSRQVTELGFEVDEAEDGEQGLSRLEEIAYDLVILDVTMPVLDGPGMLARMRERNDNTPVLMLTSESKRSVVASVMKQGIEDYILKPFKPDELKAKILKTLKITAPAASNDETGAPGATAAPGAAPARRESVEPAVTAARQFIDILVVDDMENVPKKLRTLVPQHLSMSSSVSAQSALAMCRERMCRVILVDIDIPDVNSAVLLTQLRTLQPHAAFLALCVRTTKDVEKTAKTSGFDGVVMKPFEAASIEDFLLQYFDNQDLISGEDNLVKLGAFTGKEERLDRYYQRIGALIDGFLEKIAAACFDEVVVDMSQLALRPEKSPKLVLGFSDKARKLGLTLRLAGTPEGRKVLETFTDTKAIPFYDSVAHAREGR